MRIRTKRSSTRSVAALIAATLIASVLTLVAAPSSAATAVTITTRSTLSGTDRYNTSEKVHTAAAAKNGTFTNLILASGDSFPDALSAVALAEVQDAGVLLLPADGTMTAAAVAKAVAATTIFIVGGTSALSSAVETKLKTVASAGGAGKASTAIVRYAGTNRYSTSAIVANAITAAGVASHDNKKTAILVSGANFADAVSASMLVSGPTTATATTALPIILTEADSLPMVAEVALANLAIKKIIVIGGTNAVSAAVATKAGAGRTVVRISGTDRYDTAAKVADLAVKTVATGGFGMNKREVYLAEMGQASGGADALSAGSLVNEDGSVLLGTSGGTLPAATVAWLGANNAGATGLTVGIIGGTGVIPTATEATIKTSAGGSATAISATFVAKAGGTTVTVTFSEAMLKSTCAAADLSVINSATGASVLSSACTMATVPSTALSGTTAVFTVAALTAGFEVRIPKGALGSADGRTLPLSTSTVAADAVKPVATVNPTINATATAITVTFSEPVKINGARANGTVFTVNGVAESGDKTAITCLGSTCLASVNIESIAAGSVFDSITVTNASAYSAGTTIALIASSFKDLINNTNAAASAVLVSDTVKPTVVGIPTVTQAEGAKASYSVDAGKWMITLKAAGSAGNDYDVLWPINVAETLSLATCTYASEVFTITWPSLAATDATTTDATTLEMVTAFNASATCSAVATASITGIAGAATTTISGAAQTASAAASFGGGTTIATVTTNFSEAIKAGTGVPAAGISYDGNADDTEIGSVVATTTISGSTVTTTHSFSSDLEKFVPGTSEVSIATSVLDLAGNATLADADNVANIG